MGVSSKIGTMSGTSWVHYGDLITSAMGIQVTGVSIICSAICSGADRRKHQGSASLAFVRGIHQWLVNSPHKGPVTRKLFPFDDVITNVELWHWVGGVVEWWIDLLHKSRNGPVPYPTMHHFETEMCTCVHISVTKWCIVGNCGICEMGLLGWTFIPETFAVTENRDDANFHWRHLSLSLWRPVALPVTRKSASWRLSVFGAVIMITVLKTVAVAAYNT